MYNGDIIINNIFIHIFHKLCRYDNNMFIQYFNWCKHSALADSYSVRGESVTADGQTRRQRWQEDRLTATSVGWSFRNQPTGAAGSDLEADLYDNDDQYGRRTFWSTCGTRHQPRVIWRAKCTSASDTVDSLLSVWDRVIWDDCSLVSDLSTTLSLSAC